MEYTIKNVSDISGVSTRTLRYYDEIGLLKPERISSSGYRIYAQKQLDILFQILIYRSLEFSLDDIGKIINNPSFDETKALKEHKKNLETRHSQIGRLIKKVEDTLYSLEKGIVMDNKIKFQEFKQGMIDENEKNYGDEVRNKYGDDTVNESNKKFMNMTEEDYKEMERIGNEILIKLKEAYKTGNPSSDLAREVCELHKKWLGFTWTSYSKEAHVGLAQMYVDDERFKEYYDKHQDGLTEFLRDAIVEFCK